MMTSLRAKEAERMGVEEVQQVCRTDVQNGLSTEEAARRLKVYGPNLFDINQEEPVWKKYLEQVRNFLYFFNSLFLMDCSGSLLID